MGHIGNNTTKGKAMMAVKAHHGRGGGRDSNNAAETMIGGVPTYTVEAATQLVAVRAQDSGCSTEQNLCSHALIFS